MREFQFKLLNKYLVTNAFLYKIGVVSSPVCSFCRKENESLEHILIHCNYTKEFWAEVIKSAWLRLSRIAGQAWKIGIPDNLPEVYFWGTTFENIIWMFWKFIVFENFGKNEITGFASLIMQTLVLKQYATPENEVGFE